MNASEIWMFLATYTSLSKMINTSSAMSLLILPQYWHHTKLIPYPGDLLLTTLWQAAIDTAFINNTNTITFFMLVSLPDFFLCDSFCVRLAKASKRGKYIIITVNQQSKERARCNDTSKDAKFSLAHPWSNPRLVYKVMLKSETLDVYSCMYCWWVFYCTM